MPEHLGARVHPDGSCGFTLWAPEARQVHLCIESPGTQRIAMHGDGSGYWQACVENAPGDLRYCVSLDGGPGLPDPASHWQPGGVHAASAVVDHAAFAWTDSDWHCPELSGMVIYEVHTGTFTPEGTFAAVIARLPELAAMGITAIELMPVAQFPGERNWGYDGTCLFAPQHSYGGPVGLKHLVDACHRNGLACILDVVYNHLGPEGNYLAFFGPYFTDRYRTPWGSAMNYDGAGSDAVRRFVVENALFWLRDYHMDGLRLDAVHGIIDMSARHILAELADAVGGFRARTGRHCFLIAESDLNDPRLVRSPERGGYGLDAQWNDDFHHSLHTLLTGERVGYYRDFGQTEQLVKSIRSGFVYDGCYSPSRQRRHGAPSADIPADRFLVFSQNHDQVGNRMRGERLSGLVGREALKAAAAAVLLSPGIPLLFMGEEYGEQAPFLYFVDHGDPDLIEGVRQGRAREFSSFAWQGTPPDPADPATFQASCLDWHQGQAGAGAVLRAFYADLIKVRQRVLIPLRSTCAVSQPGPGPVVLLEYGQPEATVRCLLNFDRAQARIRIGAGEGLWSKLLDSADPHWGGPGVSLPLQFSGAHGLVLPPCSGAVYCREAGGGS